MTIQTKRITADELLEMGDIGRCELIDGEIIHLPYHHIEHGAVAAEILYCIGAHIEANQLGNLYAGGTGFSLAEDCVIAPDLAFVRADRVPNDTTGYFPGAPDLAVEVISPSELWTDVAQRIERWLAAGAQSVWIADCGNRTMQVHHNGGTGRRYHATDILTDEVVLPGFSMHMADVFDPES